MSTCGHGKIVCEKLIEKKSLGAAPIHTAGTFVPKGPLLNAWLLMQRLLQGSAGILPALAPAAVSRRRRAASPYRFEMMVGRTGSVRRRIYPCGGESAPQGRVALPEEDGRLEETRRKRRSCLRYAFSKLGRECFQGRPGSRCSSHIKRWLVQGSADFASRGPQTEWRVRNSSASLP